MLEKIKSKKDIERLKKERGYFPFISPPISSVNQRVSPEFILTCNQFKEKLQKNNPILKDLKPITISELTRLLAPVIKERIINDRNIRTNIKKSRNKKKMRYYLELEA